MPVSLYGQPANMDAINQIAAIYNIPVIEDGAQSFGALYKGKRSGNLSTIGTTSFFPSKPLGCYGDGGACFTNDDDIALKIRAIKNHGGTKRFHHKYIGLNARLDTLQGAIVQTKLQWFDETIKKRNNCANYYTQHLRSSSSSFLTVHGFILPQIKEERLSVWAQYSILANNKQQRDDIVDYLKKHNINVAIFYPAPLHTQECFNYLNCKEGDLPVTENVCDRIFNLPCYDELTYEEQDVIINLIKNFI